LLPVPPAPSPWRLLAGPLVHFIPLLLWAAAGLAVIGGMPQLGVAIVAIVVLNGVFAFVGAHRAERAASACGVNFECQGQPGRWVHWALAACSNWHLACSGPALKARHARRAASVRQRAVRVLSAERACALRAGALGRASFVVAVPPRSSGIPPGTSVPAACD
jgi:hypothetical protein